MSRKEELRSLWNELYPQAQDEFDGFWSRFQTWRHRGFAELESLEDAWFRDGSAYVAYVDQFASDLSQFRERLDYLSELGITILWLLPCLDSPMVDQGFDIRNFSKVRSSLLGERGEKAFDE